jgi:acetyl esterase/lipase
VQYAGSEAALADPYAFPGNGDLSLLPPTYVLNSEADLLRASGERFAAQLASAGVPAVVEFEPGSAHGHLNEPSTEQAQRSLDRIVGWILAR